MKHTPADIALLVIAIVYNLSLSAVALLWLFTGLLDGCKLSLSSANTDLSSVQSKLFAFFASGILGGTFYCLRSIYQRLSEAYTPIGISQRDKLPDPTLVFNIRVWFFWYLYRPFQAGVLSIVVICLFSSGFLSISNLTNESLAELYFQVGLGFLIGFGTHEVINKIEEVIKVLFAKGKSNPQQSVTEMTAAKVAENNPLKS